MAELTAAKEADRVKAAARAPLEAPAQFTPHGGNRRKSGADALRSQSNDIRAVRPEDPKPNEAKGTESMVEDDEHDTNRLLEIGLEQALVVKEDTIDSTQPYEVGTSTSVAVQAEA
jgi:hypothetical protein